MQLSSPPLPCELKQELEALPTDWLLCRVGSNKRPIGGKNWYETDRYSPDEAAYLKGSSPPAWGLICGEPSGVLVLDLDAEGWCESFQEITGYPIEDLPPTIAWSSGKPGRSAHAFQVDPEWWPWLANRRSWPNAKGETCWELRWNRCQSVVLGAHPETNGYRWLKDHSPRQIDKPAPATNWLLEALLVQEHPQAKTVAPTAKNSKRAVAMLQCLPPGQFQSYDRWLQVGMALHHTDIALLSAWVGWSRGMENFDEAECQAKWRSFDKAPKGRPVSIGTLQYLAKQHGYREPPLRVVDGDGDPARADLRAPSVNRRRLATDEVLALLPERIGVPRLNIRTRAIHAGDRVITPDEAARLYVSLSNAEETWPKETTADALAHLAAGHAFDPVADYLEAVSAGNDALPMDDWQRLDQVLLNINDPIAAAFLTRYLVGAVARVKKPGCPMRQLPVLIGKQAIGKSATAAVLFGKDFFGDQLGHRLDVDDVTRLHRHWCCELAELDGITRRTDRESLKAFISRSVDVERRKYGRGEENMPRRSVFWGTSNGAPLHDPTGSTRYVCIALPGDDLPLQRVAELRDAIWCRAVQQYRAGVEWKEGAAAEREAIAHRNNDYQLNDPLADQVLAIAEEEKALRSLPIQVSGVLNRLEVPNAQRTSALGLRIRHILEAAGWEYGRRREGVQRIRGFWPPA